MNDKEKKSYIERLKNDMDFFMSIFFKPIVTMKPKGGKIVEDVVGGWKTTLWQSNIWKCETPNMVLRINRQGGKSYFLQAFMLWKCATIPNYRVVVVFPADNHTENFFKSILSNFIDIGSTFKKMYFKNVKKSKPRTILFKNKSEIRFFTAGTKSGSKAIGVRGEKADLLVIDEADYLDDADIIALFPVVTARQGDIILTSTPSGRDSYFKKVCLNANDFKTNKKGHPNWDNWTHFHYNRFETSKYPIDQRTVAQEKETMGEQGWLHEQLAEFGEETESMFRKEDIDACWKNAYVSNVSFDDVDLEDLQDNTYYTHSKYLFPTYGYSGDFDKYNLPGMNVLTVDWDKMQATPTIMICKIYCPIDKRVDKSTFAKIAKITVLNRIEIPRQEYTYTAAVDRILSLIRTYNIEYIYSDSGAGEKQIEDIKLALLSSKILDPKRVHRIAFGSMAEMIDSATKEVIKVRCKQLMVTLLRQSIEHHNIILNPLDNILLTQLKNYRIVGYNKDGTAIFNSDNEHSVDTLMMAVYCAYQQMALFDTPLHIDAADTKIVKNTGLSAFNEKLEKRIANEKSKLYMPKVELVPIPGQKAYDPDTGEARDILLQPFFTPILRGGSNQSWNRFKRCRNGRGNIF